MVVPKIYLEDRIDPIEFMGFSVIFLHVFLPSSCNLVASPGSFLDNGHDKIYLTKPPSYGPKP